MLWTVRGYGRTHGYAIGTELLSWGAGEWANVKWGSVYHALRTLTRDGLLRDFCETSHRTEYEITERGEAEFTTLLRDSIRAPRPRADYLGAAMAMLPALTRAEAIALLRERLAALATARDKAQAQLDGWVDPPHVMELFGLWTHEAEADIDWTCGLIGRLESGAYAMAGEPGSPGRPGSWTPLSTPDNR